jgi:hypothetical protein
MQLNKEIFMVRNMLAGSYSRRSLWKEYVCRQLQ